MTIKEIAKQSGVSVTTVSRYLNDGYVSQQKREIIKAVIEKNNYTRSEAAINLRGMSNELAVIVQRIGSQTTSRFLEGLVDRCIEKGIKPSLYPVKFDEQKQLQYIKESMNKNKLGTIVYSFISDFNPDYKNLIIVGQESSTHSSLYTDGKENYYNLVNSVLQNNKVRKVCLLGVDLNDVEFANRITGTKLAAKANTTTFELLESKFDLVNYELKIEKDVYYVCLSDSQAYGIISKGNEQNLKLGEDYLVSGYGNYPTSKFLNLTTIDVDYELIGKRAVDKIVNKDYSSEKIDCKIVYRNSTNQLHK